MRADWVSVKMAEISLQIVAGIQYLLAGVSFAFSCGKVSRLMATTNSIPFQQETLSLRHHHHQIFTIYLEIYTNYCSNENIKYNFHMNELKKESLDM